MADKGKSAEGKKRERKSAKGVVIALIAVLAVAAIAGGAALYWVMGGGEGRVHISTFLAPVKTVPDGDIVPVPMTIVLTVVPAREAPEVCKKYPRIRDAIVLALHRLTPPPEDRLAEQLKALTPGLIRSVNAVLGGKRVVGLAWREGGNIAEIARQAGAAESRVSGIRDAFNKEQGQTFSACRVLGRRDD